MFLPKFYAEFSNVRYVSSYKLFWFPSIGGYTRMQLRPITLQTRVRDCTNATLSEFSEFLAENSF